ncbi:brain and acute leukemia cytoplasmic protein [Megalops cyprinoides]|uniref:brain and acute leukemia cytoplasmic protein n=1 Tax=Megalops cyprinoides TaxID=118141 RepID=UPI0018650081|nr:brain and acute leukemia cytoplasmic protein [Megalops cyprinoides]
MGCGGSRADAIESKYDESWTRETESTWLTNTDTETLPTGINNNHNHNNNNYECADSARLMKENTTICAGKVAGGGSSQQRRQEANPVTESGKQPISSSSTSTNQRQAPCGDEKTKRESRKVPAMDMRFSTKEVTPAKGTQLTSRVDIAPRQRGAE